RRSMTKVAVAVMIVLVSTDVRAQSAATDAPFIVLLPRPSSLTLDVREAGRTLAIERRIDERRAMRLTALQTPPTRRVRHPVLLGAVIGGVGGFVLNASACRTGESVCTSAGNLMMAGIGAGVGAFVGWLVAGR